MATKLQVVKSALKGKLKYKKGGSSGTQQQNQEVQGERGPIGKEAVQGPTNPGTNPLQDRKPVNFKKSPQPNDNEGDLVQGGQVGNGKVSLKNKPKGAVYFKRSKK